MDTLHENITIDYTSLETYAREGEKYVLLNSNLLLNDFKEDDICQKTEEIIDNKIYYQSNKMPIVFYGFKYEKQYTIEEKVDNIQFSITSIEDTIEFIKEEYKKLADTNHSLDIKYTNLIDKCSTLQHQFEEFRKNKPEIIYDSNPLYNSIVNKNETNALIQMKNYNGEDHETLISYIFQNKMYNLLLEYINRGFNCQFVIDRMFFNAIDCSVNKYSYNIRYKAGDVLMKQIFIALVNNGNYNLVGKLYSLKKVENILCPDYIEFMKLHFKKNKDTIIELSNNNKEYEIEYINLCFNHNIVFKYVSNSKYLFSNYCKVIDLLREKNKTSSIEYENIFGLDSTKDDQLDLINSIRFIIGNLNTIPTWINGTKNIWYEWYIIKNSQLYYDNSIKYKEDIILKLKQNSILKDYVPTIMSDGSYPELKTFCQIWI